MKKLSTLLLLLLSLSATAQRAKVYLGGGPGTDVIFKGVLVLPRGVTTSDSIGALRFNPIDSSVELFKGAGLWQKLGSGTGGGGGADGNNYTTGISYSNGTLTLSRLGMPNLTAAIPDAAGSYSILQRPNDTTLIFGKANGIRDTIVFSGSGSTGGSTGGSTTSTDTTSLSNRINQKADQVALLDTAANIRASLAAARSVFSVFGRTGDVLAQSGDYTTTQVTEGTNLYFTNGRARGAISLTTTGTSGAATYNTTTGVLNVPQYGGGGGENLHQTLLNGNNTTRGIVFDSIGVKPANQSGYSKNYLRINALDTAEKAAPYLMGISANGGLNGTNHVYYQGWNIEPGGGRMNTNAPAIGFGMEQRWRPDANTDLTEWHDVWYALDGTYNRIRSYTLNNTNKNKQVYYSVNNFGIRRNTNDAYNYLFVQGTGSGTQLSLINAINGQNISHTLDTASTDRYSINNSANTGAMAFVGFNQFRFANIGELSGSAAGASLSMRTLNGTTRASLNATDVAFVQAVSATQPIQFNNSGGNLISVNNTYTYHKNPMNIGADNQESETQLKISASTNRKAIYANTTVSSGTGIGIQAQASGATTTNIGVFAQASNAGTNRGVWVGTINAATNNHAFYSDGTAQSYLNGSLGLKVATPVSTLDVVGSVGAAITTVTANTTLTADHYTILADAQAGNITITLPTASNASRRIYVIKKIDGSANTVTFSTNDGTQALSTAGAGRQVQSNGAAWYVIGAF